MNFSFITSVDLFGPRRANLHNASIHLLMIHNFRFNFLIIWWKKCVNWFNFARTDDFNVRSIYADLSSGVVFDGGQTERGSCSCDIILYLIAQVHSTL